MSEICVHHHLGLGDHFDMNGLVRYFLRNHDKVHVFYKQMHGNMIEYMYRDNNNIIATEIPTGENEIAFAEKYFREHESCTNFIRIGHEHYPYNLEKSMNKNCWEFFYEQVKVPYDVRTTEFFLQRDALEEDRLIEKLNPLREKFVFVHDDKDRGFYVDKSYILDKDLVVIENDVSENIFHFIKIIEEAEEIHCMESSFKSLIDIYSKTENIFYHDFRNQPLGTRANKNWKIIKYE